MASPKDVKDHFDVSKAVVKDAGAVHAHPHEAVPLRIASESGFAAPGLDTPAETQRPKRDAGTAQDHPVNKTLRDEDKSLIGPGLGRGGTEGPRLAPVDATCVYGDPGEKFHPGVALGQAAPQFEDVSSLLMRPRGAASDGDGDE
jgi:hypothetical protein